jgi:hypothetical protein
VICAGSAWLVLEPVHYPLVMALQAMVIAGLALVGGAVAVSGRSTRSA